jgi:lysophospholipid acyltransferase (LPLAT)-like uncharacterized protein
MKLRHPLLLRCVGFVVAIVFRLWLATLRFRIDARRAGTHPADRRDARFIYAFWHESLMSAANFATKVHVLISQHADGELIAQACKTLRIGVVRGSTTRGGSEALLELVAKSKTSHLAITPDGPKGPRRQVQLGLILLASLTGLPIVTLGVGYDKAWRANSWDRFALPWPGSDVYCVLTAPIVVPRKLRRAELERYRTLVEERFLAATHAAEQWAATGIRPTSASGPVVESSAA